MTPVTIDLVKYPVYDYDGRRRVRGGWAGSGSGWGLMGYLTDKIETPKVGRLFWHKGLGHG